MSYGRSLTAAVARSKIRIRRLVGLLDARAMRLM
jgi:hypothetical protein